MSAFWLEAVSGGWRVGAEIQAVRMTSRRLFATSREAVAFLSKCRENRAIARPEWYFPPMEGGPRWALSGGGGPVETVAA